MSERPTALLFALATLTGWAFFLGILFGRTELFVVAIPLIVALLSAKRPAEGSELRLATKVSAARLIEGDRLTLSVMLDSRAPVALAEILLRLPPTMVLSSGSSRVVANLRAGETFQHDFELRSMARGQADLGLVHVRMSDHSGLSTRDMRLGTTTHVYTYPRVPRVRHLPRPGRTRSSFGNYVAPQLGAGLEPGEIRPFAPGDRVRQVNWAASLRLGRLYVTQFHQERNADVVLLLDTLAETGARPNSSLDVSIRAAAALAAAYLARKDRVGLIEYGGYLRWIKPASGRRHMESLLEAVLPADIVFTYVAKDLTFLPAPVLPPQALVIAISPLIDDRFAKAVIDLAGRGYDLLLLAVSPIELTRRALPASPLTDVACRLWAIERRPRLDQLRDKGITLIDWDPGEPLEVALAALGSRPSWRRSAS
jgi:uncharacterized protein (DUF58 family)